MFQRSPEYATSSPYWTAPDIDTIDFPLAPIYSVGVVTLPVMGSSRTQVNAERIQDFRFSQEMIDSLRSFGGRGFGAALMSMQRWLPDQLSVHCTSHDIPHDMHFDKFD